MASSAFTESVHGGLLAPLKLTTSVSSQDNLAPFLQLDALWHYECVVSPRSPPAKLPSNPARPRSPVPTQHLQSTHAAISPRSPVSKMQAESASPTSHPVADSFPEASVISSTVSPRSHASSSSAAPSTFAPAQRQALQRVFRTFDEDGDGSVSTLEISRIFEKLGLSSSEDSLKSLLAGLVTKVQGQVDEEEFLLLYESTCCFVEQVDENASSSNVDADVDQDLLAAFHVFDKDGNGFISPGELQSVLCSLGFPQGRQLEACVDMIARVDENDDGQVDFFEFKKMFHMENAFLTTIQTF